MSPQEVLTVAEVANFLKVHPNTVYRLARKGRIPAFKMGTDWRFHRDAIVTWTQKRDHSPAKPPDLQTETHHLMHWLLSQGLGLTVTSAELASLLDVSPRVVERHLKALTDGGLVAAQTTRIPARYALTPEGIGEGQKRFAQPALPPSGHQSVVRFALRHERE